ncbi:MAG: hypothetical protein ACRD0A_08765 [Acidimicrobiales bacterium]
MGVVFYLLLTPVVMFTIPNEIKNTYEADGRPSPVTALWGLWFLLPLIGNIMVRAGAALPQRVLAEQWIEGGLAARAQIGRS